MVESVKKFKIVGHRGGFHPENTLESFKKAYDEGLLGLEMDVWLTSD